MRTSSLDALLSRSVQEVLTAVLLEREKPWYLRDLANRLERTPSTLQRPLDALVKAGILRKWEDGNRVYFARESACPFLAELSGLLAKTVGLADVLRDALRPHAKSIEVAFVFGSVAVGQQSAQSDVDLLVIGRASLLTLSPALSRAEVRLGRTVNVNRYSLAEFSERLANKNHFLRSVLAKEKIFVAGTPHELERFAAARPRRAARHKQIRA